MYVKNASVVNRQPYSHKQQAKKNVTKNGLISQFPYIQAQHHCTCSSQNRGQTTDTTRHTSLRIISSTQHNSSAALKCRARLSQAGVFVVGHGVPRFVGIVKRDPVVSPGIVLQAPKI